MKHKTIEAIEATEFVCNLVKVGGNSCVECLSTRRHLLFDETREFVELLHKHGYDVLTKNDQEFKEKLDSYNRVFELQAKKNGLTSYTKYELEELCVCGDYMFVEKDYNLPSKEVDIKDARGGKREGAGRKSKHKNLMHTETTTIRVPKLYKKDIKELIDFIIENPGIKDALFYVQFFGTSNEEKEKYSKLIWELYNKIPGSLSREY
jgi:hypothetical protein